MDSLERKICIIVIILGLFGFHLIIITTIYKNGEKNPRNFKILSSLNKEPEENVEISFKSRRLKRALHNTINLSALTGHSKEQYLITRKYLHKRPYLHNDEKWPPILTINDIVDKIRTKPCYQNKIRDNACELQSGVQIVFSGGRVIINETNCNRCYKKTYFSSPPSKIVFKDALPEEFYMLLMLSLYPPNSNEYFAHWIINNVKGTELIQGNIIHSSTALPYSGPNPPQLGNIVTYQFLLYRQKIPFIMNPIWFRERFDIETFYLTQPYEQHKLQPCTLSNLPENACSLSPGLEVAAWPPNSQHMFYIDYHVCDALVDKLVFKTLPYIKYEYAYQDRYYTLMILDHDSKGLDNGEYTLHYLASNIDGYNLQRGIIQDEYLIKQYLPPNPPMDEKYHRFVFAVYMQSDYLPKSFINTLQLRNNFNIRLWTRKQPILFCGPIASVQMKSIFFRKRIIFGILIAFLMYLLLRLKEYRIKFDSVIRRSKPAEVWEYVADFSHMLKMNPTLLDFHVYEEKGDYRSWMYTVAYTERLSQLPAVRNFGFAEFRVRPLANDKYEIESSHKTCFLTNITCLKSWSTFTFEKHADEPEATYCEEKVTYQCPVILSFLCSREVMHQRRTIATNLQQEFSRKSELK